MSPLDILSPARQNQMQRIGFFGAVTLAAVVIFLHFPFHGYVTQDSFTTPSSTIFVSPECRAVNSLPVNELTSEQMTQRFECSKTWNESRFREEDRPFSQWESKAPVIYWFGSVVNALVTFMFVLALGGLWLWVFRSCEDRGS